MRLMECVRLRVKDVDFGQGQIMVRDGKGAKERVTVLPESLVVPLQSHLEKVRRLPMIYGPCRSCWGTRTFRPR